MGLNSQRNSDEGKNDTGEGDSITLMELDLIWGRVSPRSHYFFYFPLNISNRHLLVFEILFYGGEGFGQFQLQIIGAKVDFLKGAGFRFKSMDIAIDEP